MVREEPTRKVVRRLKDAGFTPAGGRGDHTKWLHPSGVHVSIADSDKSISPGVVRQVNKAIEKAGLANKPEPVDDSAADPKRKGKK
jgi:predicted RNA binding protein YcfA (HicA-like mRNA interferase family)